MPLLRRLLIPKAFLAVLRRAPESSRLRAVFRYTVVVLGYHDIRTSREVQSWLRVDVSSFREQLRLLSTVGTFVHPTRLDDLRSLPGPGPHFLVTFDDGHANWLRLAVPTLEALGVPGLFFLSSENMQTGNAFWFDRVVGALQLTGATHLDLTSVGLPRFELSPGPPARRWDDIDRVLTAIKHAGDAGTRSVDAILQHLDDVAGSAAGADPSLRPISAEEVGQMAGSCACCFGSHAHGHQILTRLDQGSLRETLMRSREAIASATGRVVRDLAYPNGDHNDEVISGLRRAGYVRAFTTTPGVWDGRTDPYRIPRLLVGGYDSPGRVADRVGEVLLRYAVAALKAERRDETARAGVRPVE